MDDKWRLKPTNNINQMLRVRDDKSIEDITSKFNNLLIVKHQYHVADDIMFPDPACLAFFTAFEQNHLDKLEDDEKIILGAIEIFEGAIKFFIYCDEPEKTVYDCISFLKSSPLYKCDFEIVQNDSGNILKQL